MKPADIPKLTAISAPGLTRPCAEALQRWFDTTTLLLSGRIGPDNTLRRVLSVVVTGGATNVSVFWPGQGSPEAVTVGQTLIQSTRLPIAGVSVAWTWDGENIVCASFSGLSAGVVYSMKLIVEAS